MDHLENKYINLSNSTILIPKLKSVGAPRVCDIRKAKKEKKSKYAHKHI